MKWTAGISLLAMLFFAQGSFSQAQREPFEYPQWLPKVAKSESMELVALELYRQGEQAASNRKPVLNITVQSKLPFGKGGLCPEGCTSEELADVAPDWQLSRHPNEQGALCSGGKRRYLYDRAPEQQAKRLRELLVPVEREGQTSFLTCNKLGLTVRCKAQSYAYESLICQL